MTAAEPARQVGTCYYPEHWPEEAWPEDAARMAAAGLTLVRIGEFAWSRLEPAPGTLRWDWLDRAIDVLAGAGLGIVLGTPTATPPRWVLTKHPDMLAVDAEGRPRRFGSRRHYCFSHEGYRDEAARIARLMADRYGRDDRIVAWQIDNEYGCHDTTFSYSAAARQGFRDWCARRYQSPDALNRAWGNVFWSMEIADWDELDLPNLTVTEPNPAHALAFRRFSSDQVVAFNRMQADILRARTAMPLIHNYMGDESSFDHWALGADLDVASWDSYPLGFLSDRLDLPAAHKRAYLRQGDPDMQALHHDLYRAVGSLRDGGAGPRTDPRAAPPGTPPVRSETPKAPTGRWWVMEQQPGPVNWAPHNPAPLPGMARLWAHEAFAHGAEAVLYFRWRQAPFAQEQQHAGLLRPDSAAAPGLAEAAQVAAEVASHPPGTAPGQAAILFDYASAWAWDVQPQGAGFDHFHLIHAMYAGLRRLGLDVDILPPGTADLSPWPLVLIPGMACVPDALMAAIAAHEGTCILGPRTNAKTAEMAIPVPLPPNVPGLGCTVAAVESLPPDAPMPVAGGGHVRTWFEHLEGAAEPTATLEDGRPLVMSAGRTHYLAGWPDPEALQALLVAACRAEGIAHAPLPEGVRTRRTRTHRVWLNYAAEPRDTPVGTLPPAGVHHEPLSGQPPRT